MEATFPNELHTTDQKSPEVMAAGPVVLLGLVAGTLQPRDGRSEYETVAVVGVAVAALYALL